MQRRPILIAGLASLSLPGLAIAQAPLKPVKVGFLSAAGRTPDGGPPAALRDGLRKLGYSEGRNPTFESRFAEGKPERLPELAAELVALKVDAIVAQGGPAVLAAKQASSTIPIITAPVSGDLVAAGLIASPSRPGGNVTGLTDDSIPLSAKRLEILKEAVPKAALIAVIWNANDQGMTLRYQAIEKAARILKVEVHALGVRSSEEFPRAFSEMTQRRPDAIFVVADGLTTTNRKQFIEFAATQRIPAMYETSAYIRDGGLMSYGPSLEESFHRAAAYLDRIFKGAKPAELPAEYPARYYLTVNLKTAEVLGLTLPPALLFRADDVIK